MQVQISYAQNKTTGEIRHISQVPNGIKCNCKCVECGDDLIAANNGYVRADHFKHKCQSICHGGFETALHKLAKEILLNSHCILIRPNEYFNYTQCKSEVCMGDCRPDIVLGDESGVQWLIEIAVTHFVDPNKRSLLKRLNVNCIEIDLRSVSSDVTPEELKQYLLHQQNNRQLISEFVTPLDLDSQRAPKMKPLTISRLFIQVGFGVLLFFLLGGDEWVRRLFRAKPEYIKYQYRH